MQPFSEPETQAIRDFVETNKGQIQIAINFHAFGNLLIHPFNYDSIDNRHLFYDFYNQSLIYEEIWNEARNVEGMIRGNGRQTILYDANGEASDWMLGQCGIVALSPELGI